MLCLAAFSLLAGDPHLRFARMTLAQGDVAVEHAAGDRVAGERNLPVGQGFWIETAGGRAELELDDGGAIRLGPSTLVELSDLTRLSTGQRITLVSVERGTLYATGDPRQLDAFVIVAPGFEVRFLRGSRVRVEAASDAATAAVLEGRVQFSSRGVELDLEEGMTARVNPQAAERFELAREVAAGPLDEWSERRDREAAERAELEGYGDWIEAPGLGRVWRPPASPGWVPFRLGKWRWYEGLGFTWIAAEPWGWLPYHFGKWVRLNSGQWVWAAEADVFHPGDVEWRLGAGLGAGYVGWGPRGAGAVWAAYDPSSRQIDPGQALRLPADPLGSSRLVAGLPAPPPRSAVARRMRTQVAATRVTPVTPQVAYVGPPEAPAPVVIAEPAPPVEPQVIYVPAHAPPAPPPVIVEEETPSPRPRREPPPREPERRSSEPPPAAPASPPSPPAVSRTPPPERERAREATAPAGGPDRSVRIQTPETREAPARRR